MAKLKHDPQWYTPVHLLRVGLNDREIRQEYSRLRAIAQKRLKRLGEADKGYWQETETYKRYKNMFPTIKEVTAMSDQMLAYKLSALSRFIMDEENTTLKGLRAQRDKALETLHLNNYDFVTEDNFLDFGQFMEEYRAQKLDHIIGSPDAADAFNAITQKQIKIQDLKKDFKFWLDHAAELEKMKPSTGKSAGSAKAYKERLKRIDSRKAAKKGSNNGRKRSRKLK